MPSSTATSVDPPGDLPAYLPWLDVLRFYACFLVIIQHSLHSDVGFLGHVGVALFFSISGFLIGRILAAKPEATSFYARRFLRIYPAYLFTLILYGLMAFTPLLHHPELGRLFWHNITYYLTFTFRLSPDNAVMPLVIVWSLCVEEVFYLLLPVLFLLRRNQNVAIALLVIVGILLIPRFYLLPNGAGTWFFFPINLFLGVLLALLKPRQVESPWFLAVALIAVVVMTVNGMTSWFHNFGPVSAILCTATVWSLATCRLRLPAILEPLRRMGMVSYGIYLLHTFCVPIAVRLFARLEARPVLYIVCVVLLTTTITVFIASLMKRFIEDPPLKLRPMLKLHPRLQFILAFAQVSLIPTGVLLAVLANRMRK